MLADPLNLTKYNTPGKAEMVGIDWDSRHWILFYTPNSFIATSMVDTLQQYKEDHPGVECIFFGDLNAHNSDWIISSSPTDKAGLMAQEFAEMFDLKQLVHFPTREGNALDVTFSDITGKATEAPGFGNSDHKSIIFSFSTNVIIPNTPIKNKVRDWVNAPWGCIRGDVKRALLNWVPVGTVDEAESDLDDILTSIIDKYVKFKTPKRHSPSPWWNAKCEKAYKWKLKTFANRQIHPLKYQAAVKFNRKIQKKAYKAHQKRIKYQLNNLSSSDTNFWQLAKEIGGLATDRSQAAPSAQKPADHFALKILLLWSQSAPLVQSARPLQKQLQAGFIK